MIIKAYFAEKELLTIYSRKNILHEVKLL